MYIEQTKLRKSLIETPDLYTNNILVDTVECTDITMAGVSVFGQKGYKQKILNTSQMLGRDYLQAEQIYSFMMVPTDYMNSKINQIVVYDDGGGSNLPSSPTYMSAQCYEDWEMTKLVDVHYSTNAIKQNGHGGECHWEFQNFTIRKNYGVIVFSLTTEYGGLQTDTNRIRSYSIKPTSNSNNRLYIGGWGTIDQDGRERGGVKTFTTYFSAILSIPTTGWTTHIADDTLHINDDDREALNICGEFVEDAEHIIRKMQIHDQVISTLMEPQTKSSASEIGYTTWLAARVHAWNMKISTNYVGKYLSQIMVERPGDDWANHDIIKGTRHQLFVDCISYETSQGGEVVQTVVDQFFSTNKAGYDKTSENPETYATEAKWKFDNIKILPQYDVLRFRVTTEENVAQYPTSAQEKAVYSKRLTNVPSQVSWGLIDQANTKIGTETLYFKFTLNDTVDWNRFRIQTDNHISNNDIHVTADQKSKISTIDQMQTHISDNVVHISSEERDNIDRVNDLVENFYTDIVTGYETNTYNSLQLVQGETYSRNNAYIRTFDVPCSAFIGKYFSSVELKSGNISGHSFITEDDTCWFTCQCLDSSNNVIDTFFSTNKNYQTGVETYSSWNFDNILIKPTYYKLRFSATVTEGEYQNTADTNLLSICLYSVDASQGCGITFKSDAHSAPSWMAVCNIEIKTPQIRQALDYNVSKDWIVKVVGTQNDDGSISTPLTDFLANSEIIYQYKTQAVMKYETQPQNDSFTPLTLTGNTHWEIEYHISFEFPVDKQYLLDNGLGNIEDGIYPVIIPK